MPTVPLVFDPSPVQEPEHYLIERIDGNIRSVLWKQMGLCVYHTRTRHPSEEDLRKHNPNLTLHRHYGFSLGHYHEFFLENVPAYLAMRLGKVEASIGEPSPLAIWMFDNWHDEHVHGDLWESVSTARILGAPTQYYEAYLINMLRRYQERFHLQPHLMEINPAEWWEDPEMEDSEVAEALPKQYPPVSLEIEPLRCLYYAECERDSAAAFIQFFRVIEFYAFLSLQYELSSKRRDGSVSDQEFLIHATTILSRDEKGPIARLVNQLANGAILDDAVSNNLIKAADPAALGSALYDFRNSIVHAKYNQRASLVTDCVVAPSSSTEAWRSVARQLALLAIDTLGTRHIP